MKEQLDAVYRPKKLSSHRRANIKKRYGLDELDHELLLQEQEGLCGICRSGPTKREFAVDHDHKTGRVRGLLCGPCNMGLGQFKDSPKLLVEAAKYLLRNK